MGRGGVGQGINNNKRTGINKQVICKIVINQRVLVILVLLKMWPSAHQVHFRCLLNIEVPCSHSRPPESEPGS